MQWPKGSDPKKRYCTVQKTDFFFRDLDPINNWVLIGFVINVVSLYFVMITSFIVSLEKNLDDVNLIRIEILYIRFVLNSSWN